MSVTEISDNQADSRVEAYVDGTLAGFAAYRQRGVRRVFTHTTIFPEHEGKGVGSTLARGALDQARAEGFGVVPLCPFIKAWIDKHPDYADLVVP